MSKAHFASLAAKALKLGSFEPEHLCFDWILHKELYKANFEKGTDKL